jgi:hypothetical protein
MEILAECFNGVANAIVVDGAGRAFLTGRTSARDFPTVVPLQPTLKGQWNVFVSKIVLKPRLMAPDTWTPGQDVPLRGLDFTPNALSQIYSDSCPIDDCLDGMSSRTGTFDRVSVTSNNHASFLSDRPHFRNQDGRCVRAEPVTERMTV